MMNAELLAEMELVRHPWSSLRVIQGAAEAIPTALRSLFSARSPSEIQTAYWRIENQVVVQGQLFESAVATTQVLMASLVDAKRPMPVRIGILELLFQLTSGESHQSEVDRGNGDLGGQCRAAAREGLWLLYRELVEGEAAAAREVLEVIERTPDRLVMLDKLATEA
ncbi:hypothetical protein [Myxococcus fulvus]|uniref:hypothetical protein n=1 Tax=Myxococcus fulvus TaxID=33 RepID=UPI0020BD57FD|nr:hypothetical protein [Myxococcus fulvus]MCK8498028.1 hypothetical protein [Myxococcus fulvus]